METETSKIKHVCNNNFTCLYSDVDIFDNRNCHNMSNCDHENVCESSIKD